MKDTLARTRPLFRVWMQLGHPAIAVMMGSSTTTWC